MQWVRATYALAATLSLQSLGMAASASASSVPTPDVMANSILSTQQAQEAGKASGAIRPFVNPNLPDSCTAGRAASIVCDRSYAWATWPVTSQYPYWMRVYVFESSDQARQEVSNLKRYRPTQVDVVGTARNEVDAMSLTYSHSWGDDTSWSTRREGRYLVEATCSAGRLNLDSRLLVECSEGVVEAQLRRLADSLGQGVLPPGPPSGVSAAWDGDVVRVTWLPPGDDGGALLDRYVVHRDSGEEVCRVEASSVGLASCDVAGLKDGDRPTFVVYAENAVGRSPVSSASNRVNIQRVLAAPSKIRVKVEGDKIRVTWRAIPRIPANGRVRYTVTSSPGGEQCRTRKSVCVFRNLESGRSYFFQLVASSSGRQSAAVVSKDVQLPERSIPRPSESGSSSASPTESLPKPEQQFS